jgi:hypothetical protein
MPRFGIKALLVAFTVVAVWLSTFSNYRMAEDVRRSILLMILLASGSAVLWGRGRARAFWIGFFAAMLLCGGTDLQRPLHRYVPDFAWQWNVAPYGPPTAVYAPVPMPALSGTVVTPQNFTISTGSIVVAPPLWSVALNATLVAVWILGLSFLAGLVGVFLYDRNQASKSISISH